MNILCKKCFRVTNMDAATLKTQGAVNEVRVCEAHLIWLSLPGIDIMHDEFICFKCKNNLPVQAKNRST
ncbi:hypothetical protein LCGC14_1713120 [marine sediment metagenome]|uniref:Uncharacterized protein n=1 Tax=marine sediment metagenome TaxID=412755 RepID=A0A0F9JV29_9ZZZZ